MLRRKLLIIFGSLVVLLMAMGAGAIWMLQGMLERINHLNTTAAAFVDTASALHMSLTTVEIDLYQLHLGQQRHLDTLIEDVENVRALTNEIGRHYAAYEPGTERHFREIEAKYPAFERVIGSLATVQDAELAARYSAEALTRTMELRRDVQQIDRAARRHADREQRDLARRFRWLVLGMALGGMAIINVTILVLLRTAGMVLRPVDQLVEASRQFRRERFDHRAPLDRTDEFSELARAYNDLAERVQTAEHQRMETIAQVALTLNHELNNAMATIELHLQLLSRQSDGDEKLGTCLHQMGSCLRRMAATVESLKHIRRIVLTDYIAGVKMLDLQQSVAEDPGPSGPAAAPPDAKGAS